VASLAQSSDSARSWDDSGDGEFQTYSAISLGFDSTFRMAVEDQSLDGAVGRMEDALTSASVRRVQKRVLITYLGLESIDVDYGLEGAFCCSSSTAWYMAS
jgi:hypothetical protein